MSGNYMSFTPEQKERARHMDIAELLRKNGETLKRSGSEYEWKDNGQKVTIRGNLWFHQYDREGGDAIEFCRRFYGMNFPQAVKYLLEGDGVSLTSYSPPIREEPYKQNNTQKKTFSLPSKNGDMKRTFDYLCGKRNIDSDVLKSFVESNMIYESAGHHNVVFVGYDTEGNPRHASKRGTVDGSTYKGNEAGSVPEFSFHHFGSSNELYLFEAPIDMLSYISMNKENWQQHNYAAACSVSDKVLFQCLKDRPDINEVCLCLDNDDAGQAAEKRISEKLAEQGVKVKTLIPLNKDWNEDLTYTYGADPTDDIDLEQEGMIMQM